VNKDLSHIYYELYIDHYENKSRTGNLLKQLIVFKLDKYVYNYITLILVCSTYTV
jgi:hypothetical protein